MAVYCPEKNGPALYLDCKECTEKTCKNFFCLVVGSRSFDDYELLKEKLDYLLQGKSNVTIVSGGAKGADSLAEKYANEKGYDLKVFPANWNEYGKRAGYLRNTQMHEFISKQAKRGVVAFWDGVSKGTTHNFELAKQFNNEIRIINFTKNE